MTAYPFSRQVLKSPWLLLASVLLFGCETTHPATALVVEINSNLSVPQDIDTIEITATGSDASTTPKVVNLTGARGLALPLRFAYVPEGSKTGALTIWARARLGTKVVVERKAVVQFIAEKTSFLVVNLNRDCVEKLCTGESETCREGECRTSTVTPNELVPYLPSTDAAVPPDQVDAPKEGGDTANPGDEIDSASLPCAAGALGCSCKGDICDEGLVCRGSQCVSPTCGNGKVEPGEDCDDGSANTNDVDLCSLKCESCSKRKGYLVCGETCLAGAECCPGTPCGETSKCAGNTFSGQSVCGTDGKCPSAKPTACDSFLTCLDGASCRMKCSADNQCTLGRRCQNGTCITPSCGNGTVEGDEKCDDGNMNDTDLCSNACVSCSARAGFMTCGNSCIQGATCCPGASCSGAMCTGNSYTPAQICSGAGQCPAGAPATCGKNFTCESTSCRTSCSSNAQCANGTVCFNGDCIAPVCGNGTVEPGEQCDNGANNDDSKICSKACVACAARSGWKECAGGCIAASQCCGGCPANGGGLNTIGSCNGGTCAYSCTNTKCASGACLPPGQTCCDDRDCPSPSTSGKCDLNTKTCWNRVKMDMDFNPALTGSYVAGESTLQADPWVVLLDRSSEWKGLVGFMSRVPAGSVIEVASLSVYQSWVTTDYNDPNHVGSTVDPYRYGKLRVAGCNYEINGPKNCPISAQDAIICSNRGYMTCTGDVTEAVRRGQFRFALGFVETSTTQGILWFDDPALQRPSLRVTWLQH